MLTGRGMYPETGLGPYLDVEYAACAIATAVTLGRFYIRGQSSGLDWDDLFNGLAALCLLAYTSNPNLSDESTAAFWKSGLATYMLNWTILWLVKASFLAFCWNIFKVSPNFRRAWWVIAIYTFLSYWPLSLATLWQCGDPSKYDDPITCQAYWESEQSQITATTVYGLNFALHLSSELLILGLPLWFINKIQWSSAQKTAAASMFFAVILTILMGFLRNLANLCDNGDNYAWEWIQGFGLLYEQPVAVLVCALPPYRNVLSKLFKRKKALPELRQNKPVAPPAGSITELERYVV